MKDDYKAHGSLIIAVFLALTSCTKTEIPQVSTMLVTNITAISAESGGNILSDGGEEIISCGICWDSVPYPTMSDSIKISRTIIGEFRNIMSSLIPGRTYHVRAFATNVNGTAYGEDIAFSTPGKPFCIANKPQIRLGYETNYIYMSGYLYPASSPTTVTFELNHTTNNNYSHNASQGPFDGGNLIFIHDEFFGFSGGYPLIIPKGTYHFRIKVENSAGIMFSDYFLLVLENDIINY